MCTGLKTCPRCHGAGVVSLGTRVPQSLFAERKDYEVACLRCGGSGEVFDPENEGVNERWAQDLARVVEIAAKLVEVGHV